LKTLLAAKIPFCGFDGNVSKEKSARVHLLPDGRVVHMSGAGHVEQGPLDRS